MSSSAILAAFAANTSNVRWCEAEVAPYAWPGVLEAWNSASSTIYAVAGVLGLLTSLRLGLAFCYTETMLIVVGLGSTLFHATGSLVGELLDELPMSLMAFGYIWQLDGLHWLMRPPYRRAFYGANLLAGAIAWAAYLVLSMHDLFVFTFTCQVLVPTYFAYSIARQSGCSTNWWWGYAISMVSGRVCWELERALWRAGACPETDATAYYLHTVWHFASCSAHACCQQMCRSLQAHHHRQSLKKAR